MLDRLYSFQDSLLGQTEQRFVRSLAGNINWKQRMLGIRGLRGTGKTTLLLQHLKFRLKGNGLYVTADHPWFYEHGLFDLAEEFVKMDGQNLLIDDIHKYPKWSTELKNIYDGFPGLQVIFTSSSALQVQRGEADLSRRVITYELGGLSFREHIEYITGQSNPVFGFEQILKEPRKIIDSLTFPRKVLPLFKQYLQTGYFPFGSAEAEGDFLVRLTQVINTVLETDLALIEGYSAYNVQSIKKLLGILSESVPFTPNISALAGKMQLGRDTVNNFIIHLKRARILNLLYQSTRGVAALQKPDKIYLENTNFSFALKDNPDKGSLRETFFLNQVLNSNNKVTLPQRGDFLVNGKWTVEIGGQSKNNHQLKNIKNSYLAIDGIEQAVANSIPLWLFGFLY